MSVQSLRERVALSLLGGEGETQLSRFRMTRDSIERDSNFHRVFNMVSEIDTASKDFVVPVKDLRAGLLRKGTEENLGLMRNSEDKVYGHEFSNWSLNQLCSTVDVPAQYIKKCMASDEFAFGADNLNKWLYRLPQDKEYLLRTTNNRLHGFLTDRYAIFDDKEVLDVTQSAMNGIDGHKFGIMQYLVSPELFSIRLVSNQCINIQGEDLSVAYKIWNSRVGASSLNLEFFIFKWACTNGLIVGGGKLTVATQRHVKINKDIWADKLQEIIGRTPQFVHFIKDAVESARVDKLDNDSLEKIFNDFKESYKAPDVLVMGVKSRMEDYGGNTRWAVIQSITELAQNYSAETQERYERFAGSLLTQRVA